MQFRILRLVHELIRRMTGNECGIRLAYQELISVLACAAPAPLLPTNLQTCSLQTTGPTFAILLHTSRYLADFNRH